MTANYLGNVVIGNGDLNSRGLFPIDNLEADGICIINDADNEKLNKIGDAIGDKLQIICRLRLLVIDCVELLGQRYSSVASASAASAAALAASASLASCFLDFLGASSTLAPSSAAFTRAATASVS